MTIRKQGFLDMRKDPRGASVTVACETLNETDALARRLARHLAPGDVMLLDGPLAAGKTTFVARICAALDCDQQATSPTYALSHVYTCPRFEVFHIDAYRLDSVAAFHHLGLDEFFPEALALIEWGSRIEAAFPDALRCAIAFGTAGTEARQYTLTGPENRWQAVLDAVTRQDDGA